VPCRHLGHVICLQALDELLHKGITGIKIFVMEMDIINISFSNIQ